MGHSVLASTYARKERYAAEGRDCRMDGRCYSRATHVVTVDDHGVGQWTFCRKHMAQFVDAARYYGHCNAANPESRLLSVMEMDKTESGDDAKHRALIGTSPR